MLVTPSEMHAQWIAEGNSPIWSITPQIAQYLSQTMSQRTRLRVLDLGSGLSSAILRSHDADVWSVDERASYLARTKQFVEARGLPTTHMMTWDEFGQEDHGKFDLIFMDTGPRVTRMQLHRWVIGLAEIGGTVIFDDGDMEGYEHMVGVYAQIQGNEYSSMPDLATAEDERYPLRLDVRKKQEPLKTCVVLSIPRAMVCYDEAFMAFMRIAQQGWALADLPPQNTALARDRLAINLLEHIEFTHMVMLDQDHVHPVDVVMRLAKHVHEDRSKWVVGGLNHRRAEPFDPCAYWMEPETRHAYTIPPAAWGDELREVDLLGTGCVIMAREVFETFGPTWFGYTYDKAAYNLYPSDDTAFSHRATQAGIKLWCDPTLCSPHLRFEQVDRKYFEQWIQQRPGLIDAEGNVTLYSSAMRE